MNFEEFKEKENELQTELSDLRRDYYFYCNELFSEYNGKKVKIEWGDEETEVFWDGWTMPRGGHIEPLAYKIKKDGTKSCFRESFWGINPGNIKIRISEEQ